MVCSKGLDHGKAVLRCSLRVEAQLNLTAFRRLAGEFGMEPEITSPDYCQVFMMTSISYVATYLIL